VNYEKKVLQQTAVMVNDSTNINKMNNYLSHQIIANNKDLDIIMPMEIQFLDRDKNVAGVPLNWSVLFSVNINLAFAFSSNRR
jgi:hypothetical protein